MPKILVVDDSISVRKALERILVTRDMEVLSAGSAEEALDLLSTNSPDLVIADVVMPGMDGFELCHTLAENPALNHLPTLLISGIVTPEVSVRAEQVGALGIVKKPFTPDDLFPKVNNALTKQPATMQTNGAMKAPPLHEPEPRVTETPTPSQAHTLPAIAEPEEVVRITPNPAVEPAVARPEMAASTADEPAEQSEGVAQLLERLLENPNIDSALMATRSGMSLAHVGKRFSVPDTVSAFCRTLNSVAGVLGEHLNLSEQKSVTLEYGESCIFIQSVDAETMLVLEVEDTNTLGMVRYLVRKELPKLIEALKQ